MACDRAAKIMATAGQQVTLTVAKQGAVHHGLAMLICEEPQQSLPSMMRVFYSLFVRVPTPPGKSWIFS